MREGGGGEVEGPDTLTTCTRGCGCCAIHPEHRYLRVVYLSGKVAAGESYGAATASSQSGPVDRHHTTTYLLRSTR